jgi:uncharacterized iron-regulated membrane protein
MKHRNKLFRRLIAGIGIVILGMLVIAGTVSVFLTGGTANETFSTESQGLDAGGSYGSSPPNLERAEAEIMMDEAGQPAAQPASQQAIERLIIRNANLTLEVSDVPEAEQAVRAQVSELQGYVVSAETNGSGERLYATITFRVPADNFDRALQEIEGLANRVRSRTVSGEDVTEEFVDLEARLRNLEATEARLLDFLDQAATVDEALNVSTRLTDIQGQIEQVTGRMQYLEESAALSTVTVSLQPEPGAPIVQAGWQPGGVARDALDSLIAFSQGVLSLIIVALVWTPIWLPLVLFGGWLWRRRRSSPRPDRSDDSPAAPAT